MPGAKHNIGRMRTRDYGHTTNGLLTLRGVSYGQRMSGSGSTHVGSSIHPTAALPPLTTIRPTSRYERRLLVCQGVFVRITDSAGRNHRTPHSGAFSAESLLTPSNPLTPVLSQSGRVLGQLPSCGRVSRFRRTQSRSLRLVRSHPAIPRRPANRLR